MSQVLCLAFVKVIYRVFQLGCAIALPFIWALFVVLWLVTKIVDCLTGGEQK